MYATVNKESQKIYNRKYQLLTYYNEKQNKTENDLKKIEELKIELINIKKQNKTEGNKNHLQIQLNRLKDNWENSYMTMFDIEDILFCLEMQRKTEIMTVCTDIFLAINKRYYFNIKIVLRQTS